MPVSNHLRRLLVQTIADNINEVTLGFDGTTATSSDGAAGRPAITLTPTVTVIDDDTVLVEAVLPFADSFDETIKEVYVQFRGASSFTPIGRFTTRPITKTTTNELVVQITIEVA
jgi:hypothetical protein|tara:strand:+ start:4496 stop:4840 length:345 start_codon:yes stop_codon:yes gene_type:complete